MIIINKKGFTYIELMVIGLGTIIAAISVPIFGSWQTFSQLNEATVQIIQTIRLAREYSLARHRDSAQGVYFEINSSANDKFILYQGDSYATRDSDYDREIVLKDSLSLSTTLTNNEVNFSLGLGLPGNAGTVTLTSSNTNTKDIEINSYGMVEEK